MNQRWNFKIVLHLSCYSRNIKKPSKPAIPWPICSFWDANWVKTLIRQGFWTVLFRGFQKQQLKLFPVQITPSLSTAVGTLSKVSYRQSEESSVLMKWPIKPQTPSCRVVLNTPHTLPPYPTTCYIVRTWIPGAQFYPQLAHSGRQKLVVCTVVVPSRQQDACQPNLAAVSSLHKQVPGSCLLGCES